MVTELVGLLTGLPDTVVVRINLCIRGHHGDTTKGYCNLNIAIAATDNITTKTVNDSIAAGLINADILNGGAANNFHNSHASCSLYLSLLI